MWQVYEHELSAAFPSIFCDHFSPHFVSKFCDAMQIFCALRMFTTDARTGTGTGTGTAATDKSQ